MGNVHGIGVVGGGVVFGTHMRAYQGLSDRARVVGLAEPDTAKRRRAADQHFIPVLEDDYRSLLDRSDIDVIDICAPPTFHEKMAIDALEAGKYVICEKPLAPSLAAADRIVAADRAHPNRLAAVYQFRTTTAIRRMRLMLEEGHAGKTLLTHCERLGRLAGSAAGAVAGWGQWDLAGGGVLMTRTIHQLDLMIHLMGSPVEVTGWMDTLANPIESEDTCGATIKFENGARATLFCTLASHGGDQIQFQVIADSLMMQTPWRLQSNDHHLAKRADRRAKQAVPEDSRVTTRGKVIRKARSLAGRAVPALKPAPPPSSHEPFVKAVLDAIDNDGPMPVDAAEARRSIELCTAIYTAAITGETVSLPLDETSRFYEGITTEDYDGKTRYKQRTTGQTHEAARQAVLPS